MIVRELTTEADIVQAFPLMRQLRDRIRERLGFTFHTAIPCSIDVKNVRGRS